MTVPSASSSTPLTQPATKIREQQVPKRHARITPKGRVRFSATRLTLRAMLWESTVEMARMAPSDVDMDAAQMPISTQHPRKVGSCRSQKQVRTGARGVGGDGTVLSFCRTESSITSQPRNARACPKRALYDFGSCKGSLGMPLARVLKVLSSIPQEGCPSCCILRGSSTHYCSDKEGIHASLRICRSPNSP